MTIAMIRHGQTDWNLAGRVQGHTDIHLNDTGRQQALAAAEVLSNFEWHGIISSPLRRAHETAEIIAEKLGLEIFEAHPGLIERNFGEAEGRLVSDIPVFWPDRDFPGGEPASDLTRRCLDTLESLNLEHDGRRLIAVTHGAYIRRLVSFLTDLPYSAIPRVNNAMRTELVRAHSDWQIITFNDEAAGSVLPKDAKRVTFDD